MHGIHGMRWLERIWTSSWLEVCFRESITVAAPEEWPVHWHIKASVIDSWLSQVVRGIFLASRRIYLQYNIQHNIQYVVPVHLANTLIIRGCFHCFMRKDFWKRIPVYRRHCPLSLKSKSALILWGLKMIISAPYKEKKMLSHFNAQCFFYSRHLMLLVNQANKIKFCEL